MIRLALIGSADENARLAQLALRVRGAQVAAIFEQEPPTAPTASPASLTKNSSRNFIQLLEERQSDFDAVVIQSGSPGAIAEICKAGLRAGKHVLVNDPWQFDLKELADLVSTSSVADARLSVGHAFRFQPSIQSVKKSLDSKQLGEPGLLRIHSWEPSTINGRDAQSADERASRTLFSRVAIQLDLACWMFGSAPNSVYACSRGGTAHPNLDYVQVHLGFSEGGMALVDCAQTLPPGDGYFSLTLIGSQGAAYADDHHNMQLLYAGGNPQAVCTRPGELAQLAQLQDFVLSLNEQRPPSADTLQTLRVAQTVVASLKTRQAFRRTGDQFDPVATDCDVSSYRQNL